MTSIKSKINVGVVGCGAIGSRIALSTKKELKNQFHLVSLYDIDRAKAINLSSKFSSKINVPISIDHLIRKSDIIVEAVNTTSSIEIVRKSLLLGKTVLVMSIGRLIGMNRILGLAYHSKGEILMPSGAIAGLDAIKAASLSGIKSLSLTTIKPVSGFMNNPYVEKTGLLKNLNKKEVVLFEGNVKDAVRYFPQNINVAAAISFAAGKNVPFTIRIVASTAVEMNSHEIHLEGPFGKITTKCENEICPDNPKTSYLAVLSAIETLKEYASNIKVGT